MKDLVKKQGPVARGTRLDGGPINYMTEGEATAVGKALQRSADKHIDWPTLLEAAHLSAEETLHLK